MSESYAVVIPVDPKAALPETAEAVREALARIVGTDRSRVKDYGKLQFIDCGESFETLACPACAASIGMDVWSGWMDEDWHGEDGFRLHRHPTPCCNESVTLNDLVYFRPQGFARWFVSAYDTTHGPLTEDETRALSKVAGMPLRAIYQHY
jgi:hypothetical protein